MNRSEASLNAVFITDQALCFAEAEAGVEADAEGEAEMEETRDQFLNTTFVSRTFPVTGLVSCSDSQRSIAALRTENSEDGTNGTKRNPQRSEPNTLLAYRLEKVDKKGRPELRRIDKRRGHLATDFR